MADGRMIKGPTAAQDGILLARFGTITSSRPSRVRVSQDAARPQRDEVPSLNPHAGILAPRGQFRHPDDPTLQTSPRPDPVARQPPKARGHTQHGHKACAVPDGADHRSTQKLPRTGRISRCPSTGLGRGRSASTRGSRERRPSPPNSLRLPAASHPIAPEQTGHDSDVGRIARTDDDEGQRRVRLVADCCGLRLAERVDIADQTGFTSGCLRWVREPVCACTRGLRVIQARPRRSPGGARSRSGLSIHAHAESCPRRSLGALP